AVVTHDPLQALVTIHRAARMHVEEPHLRDRLRANVVIFVVLRASFETTTAGHATRVSITLHHVFLVHTRSRAKIVSSVEFNPGMNSLEVIEHLRAIDD